MDGWDGWPFARGYMLLVALAFVVVGLQVFLFHWRAGFARRTMYGPVLFAPVLVVAGVVGAVEREGWLGWVVFGIFAFGVVEGLIGVYEHVRGIAHRIGGFSLRNLLSGPPPLLPVAFAALGVTGALAVVWGAV
jgi:hypothetical protein